jgi:hypothetical protein
LTYLFVDVPSCRKISVPEVKLHFVWYGVSLPHIIPVHIRLVSWIRVPIELSPVFVLYGEVIGGVVCFRKVNAVARDRIVVPLIRTEGEMGRPEADENRKLLTVVDCVIDFFNGCVCDGVIVDASVPASGALDSFLIIRYNLDRSVTKESASIRTTVRIKES